MEDAVLRDIMELGGDIVASERFEKARHVPHHRKSGNIALHSLETTGYALLLVRYLARHDVNANERDVVRASLLHDIGMTEDEVFLSPSPIKAHTHPREGVRIARDEFGANEVQQHAIARHMWPICVVPPRSIEGWIVTAADKCCSIREVGRSAEDIVDVVGRRLLHLWGRFKG